MQLTYRFQTYVYTPGAVQPHHRFHAVNWRFRTPKNDGAPALATPSHLQTKPQVINWRFQIAVS